MKAKAGDIVVTPMKGFWRVVEVEERYATDKTPFLKNVGDRIGDLITLELVVNGKGLPAKTKTDELDESWCRVVTKEQVAVSRAADTAKWDLVESLLPKETD